MKNDIEFVKQSSQKSMTKRWLAPLISLAVIAAIGGAWMLMHAKNTDAEAKESAKVLEQKNAVQELSSSDFAIVETRELHVVLPISGALTALNQATIKSKVAGEVRKTLVTEGTKVVRGQVILRIETGDLKARLQTQLAAQDDAKAKLSLAQKNHETNLTLMKQKFISQTAFDAAQNNVEIAQAAVKSAESQVDIARRALSDAKVRAPIDGIISKRFIQPGEKASPDTPLFSLVDLSQMILEAQVPASEIPRIKVGQEATFAVEGFQQRQFNGRVERINPAAEAGSRSMTVYIAVRNADGALRSGMFAKGGITLEKSAALPLLPLAALRVQNGVNTVLKIEGDKVVSQAVQLGLRNEDEGLVAVNAGLTPGATVIVAKLDSVKAGTKVKLPVKATVSGAKS